MDRVGIIQLGVICLFVLILLVTCFLCIAYNYPEVQKVLQNQKDVLMWNTVIRYLQQSYMKIVYTALAAMTAANFSWSSDGLQVFMLPLSLAFLVWSCYFLYSNVENLEEEHTKKHYGVLY